MASLKNPGVRTGVFFPDRPLRLASPSCLPRISGKPRSPAMPRALLLILLLIAPTLRASDLELLVQPPQLGDILARLPDSQHPRFAVVDYGRPSTLPRLYLFDRRSHALLGSYRVAHGKGSDIDHDGIAERFSNAPGSRASSLGLFRTAEVFDSEEPGHGRSMRLMGLSPGNQQCRSARHRHPRQLLHGG